MTEQLAPRRSGELKRRPRPNVSSARRRLSRGLGGRTFLILAITLVSLWTLMPLLWGLLITQKPPIQVYSRGILPDQWNLDAFGRVLQRPNIWDSARNSVVLAVGTTVLTLSVSLLAAYAFARFKFLWRHSLLFLMLIFQLVPSISLVVPLFKMFSTLGILNSYLAIMIVFSAQVVPLTTWVITGFIQNLPTAIEEAAAVDGAGLWQRLRWIVLPMTVPALLAAGVLTFREAWNEFPLILALTTKADARTLPYELFLLRDSLAGVEDLPMQVAFALMTVVPLLLVYLRLEKYVVSGLTRGSLK